jgi:hypothetical protein
MKRRFAFLIALAAVLVFAFMIAQEPAVSDHAEGYGYSTYWTFEVNTDSTVKQMRDTSLTLTDGTSKIFRFDAVGDYGSLQARWMIEYTTLDTGTDGSVCDTAKDTVIMIIYTSDQTMTASKVIYTDTLTAFHVTASVVNGDYTWVDLSDSVTGDNVYVTFEAILEDSVSDASKERARLAAGINYKANIKFWAK